MQAMTKAAGNAALIIFLAMLVHVVNGLWAEPTFLGFKDYTDYAKMDKILNALGSPSFTSSGFAHIITGFMTPILGLGIYELYKKESFVSSRIALVASIIAGTGYLLTGITDVTGAGYTRILMEFNPGSEQAVLLASTYLRSMAVTLGVVSMGWLAGQISWCIMKSGHMTVALGYFGWFACLMGVGMLAAFMPYFIIFPIWALWLGLSLKRIK